MLSFNFSLVRKSSIRKLDKKILLYVFLVFSMDMYDMALFAGYAIYLSPVLLHPYNLYQCLPLFALLFSITQIAKFTGFIYSFYTLKTYRYYSMSIIALSYLCLAFFQPYSAIGWWSFVFFVFFRLVQGFCFGSEMAFAIGFANTISHIDRSRLSWYYFILMSGEVGILLSIFFNRLLISHGIALITYEVVWRIQFMLGFAAACLCLYLKSKSVIKYTKNKLTQAYFKYTIIHEWRYMLLRSVTIFYTALLIILVIVRVPNILEIAFKWSHKEINNVVLFVTIFGAAGTNSILILKKIFKPIQIMIALFLISIIGHVWLWFHGLLLFHHYYKLWIYAIGFMYGAFLRLTPTFIYTVNDFQPHNRLLGRYLSYLISYTIFVSIAIMVLDYSHYLQHSIHDVMAIVILVVAAVLGIISLLLFKPYSEKMLNKI